MRVSDMFSGLEVSNYRAELAMVPHPITAIFIFSLMENASLAIQ